MLEIPREKYEAIAQMISSDESPVGIDAKHTHVLILNLLMDIDERLKRLEADQ